MRKGDTMEVIAKVSGYFVKLEMPDPRSNWRRMLGCVAFLVMLMGAFLMLLYIL